MPSPSSHLGSASARFIQNTLLFATIASLFITASCGNNNGSGNGNGNGTGAGTTSPASVTITAPGPVNYAGGSAESVAISVTNDQTGDALTASLSFSGAACSASTCGSVGSVTGSAGNYTLSYTPPASVATATTITLTVSSNLTSSFAGTVNFPVNPAGVRVLMVGGPGQRVIPGSGAKALSVTVYDDTGGGDTGASLELLAAGYACPAATGGGTVCGKLATGAITSGTTTTGTTGIPYTTVAFTYTPPASIPNTPYDRPQIVAVSNADDSKVGIVSFILASSSVAIMNNNSRLNTAVTGSAPITISATVGGDTGTNKTLSWSLTANGANCSPACGSLGTPLVTWNGMLVNGTVLYTPPATVPTGASDTPTITVTSVDVIGSSQLIDSSKFQINQGTCGIGNNAVLNGQYAFLIRGGGAGQGYTAFIGSFTANGTGSVTGGLLDINRTGGAATGLSIVAGSSYSVGSDNRGCLTLVNSSGGTATYRIALGTISGGVATKGNLVRFDDTTGNGQRGEGILLKQDSTSFATSAISGNYVVGEEGVDNAGGRIALAGVYSANGTGSISNFTRDVDAAGSDDTNDATGSGTYSIASNGRGTSAFTTTAGTSNAVLYMVGASEFLSMTTDPLSSNTPILSGDNRKQTTTSYTQTSLDGNSYVYYETGVDPSTSNGGDVTLVGLVQFTTNGAETGSQDKNDNGTLTGMQPVGGTFTIGSNGRCVIPSGGGILYLISPASGFIVGQDDFAASGFAQQQVGAPFTAASFSGQFFFGGEAPLIGGGLDSGTANPNGLGSLPTTLDDVEESGLGSGSLTMSYTVASAPTGLFTLTNPGESGGIGFVVSTSEVVFMSNGTDPSDPELFISQK